MFCIMCVQTNQDCNQLKFYQTESVKYSGGVIHVPVILTIIGYASYTLKWYIYMYNYDSFCVINFYVTQHYTGESP